jgi:hypothetical protein
MPRNRHLRGLNTPVSNVLIYLSYVEYRCRGSSISIIKTKGNQALTAIDKYLVITPNMKVWTLENTQNV